MGEEGERLGREARERERERGREGWGSNRNGLAGWTDGQAGGREAVWETLHCVAPLQAR